MPDQDSYEAALAGQLATRRPDLLNLAEEELALFRDFKATVARFLHNPAIALDVRQALAQDLRLPTPEK